MPTAASPPSPSSDLSDQEWAILVPVLPPPTPGGRPRTVDLRRILDGLFPVRRSGCQWRLLPRDDGPWSTGRGRRAVVDGPWSTGRGRRAVVDGL